MDRSFLNVDFKYSRVKDKTDKSLEIYKFYINSLYVAITRSICNVYMIESNPKHKLLCLLDVNQIKEVDIKAQESSREEWQKEANKLLTQGKQEQAKAIEDNILQHTTVPWQPIDNEELTRLRTAVFEQKVANKKDTFRLLNYAMIYSNFAIIKQLQDIGIKAANNTDKCMPIMIDEYFNDYNYKKIDNILKIVDRYGTDFRNQFNLTPLMAAVYVGKQLHVKTLISLGASLTAVDNNNRNAFMIAISRATDDKKYCTGVFHEIYHHLKPDAILLKLNNKLVKIEEHKSEYFCLYLLVTKIKNSIDIKNGSRIITFRSGDIINMLQDFPDDIIPSYRKSRQYIQGLLARNEVDSKYTYSKRLFERMRIGIYTLNSLLQIKLNDKWEDLYSSLMDDESDKSKNLRTFTKLCQTE